MSEKRNKRFYRSSDDSVVSGIARGIVEYKNLDMEYILYIRMLFLLGLFIFNGAFVFLYIGFSMITPSKNFDEDEDIKNNNIANETKEENNDKDFDEEVAEIKKELE